jgi:hypothetical protein
MSEAEVIAEIGNPQRIYERMDQREYEYNDYVVRFDSDSRKMCEVTLAPTIFEHVEVDKLKLDWRNHSQVFESLCREDGEPIDSIGFIIFYKLGIAMTGFHDGQDSQKAISVFRKGLWKPYPEDKPYQFDGS